MKKTLRSVMVSLMKWHFIWLATPAGVAPI